MKSEIRNKSKNEIRIRNILNKSFDQTFSKVWPPAGPPEAIRQSPEGLLCLVSNSPLDFAVNLGGLRT
jgi:hypothetical protein